MGLISAHFLADTSDAIWAIVSSVVVLNALAGTAFLDIPD